MIYYYYYENEYQHLKEENMNSTKAIYPNLKKDTVSLYNKKRRIRKRVKYIIENSEHPTFITLTLNKKNINKNIEYLHKEIKKALNKYIYIYNIDYGEKNNRLHFHALINGKFDNKLWKHGLSNFIEVKKSNKDIKCITEYINKFVNHTLKNANIFYSRIKGK